jgi:DNA-binding beta-propeller fold protein YncE
MARNFKFILTALAVAFSAPPAPAAEIEPRHMFSIDGFYKDRFDNISSVAVDGATGEVYVVDKGRGEILVYDKKGFPLFRFGKTSGVASPIDLVVKDGLLYVSEEGKGYIQVFNYRAENVGRVAPEGMEFSPGRLDMDEEGNIYAVNRATNECFRFDRENRFTNAIGRGLYSLTGCAAGGGRVYLITPFFKGRAIHVYSPAGEHIMSFEALEGEGGTLGLPSSAKVDAGATLYLADALRGIIVYGKDGKEIARFGELGAGKESLQFPTDIDLGSDGMIYIVDTGAKRISVFK